MSTPNDYLNFGTSPDPLSELPSQAVLEYLNNTSAQGEELVNVPDTGADYLPSLSLPLDHLGLLPVPRQTPPLSAQFTADDFLEFMKANGSQPGAATEQGGENAQGNGAGPNGPKFVRSVSDVTVDMLHRNPSATGKEHQAVGSEAVLNWFPTLNQQSQTLPTVSAIPVMRHGNTMPAPLPSQGASGSGYGTNTVAAAPPHRRYVSGGRLFSIPREPGHAQVGIGAESGDGKRLQIAEPRALRVNAEPLDGIQKVVPGDLAPPGHPSGTLQDAKQDGEGTLANEQESREGAVVRRVLKRMAKKTSDIPSVLSRICGEPSGQSSGENVNVPDGVEKRGTKRKNEGAGSEEELKKLRRVRNRESVEKCRAKQRMRLEKLEEEDKALRAECELMRQMAEVFHEKWKAVAEEYRRICGKDAGECPLVIPSNIELPEVATLSTGDGC